MSWRLKCLSLFIIGVMYMALKTAIVQTELIEASPQITKQDTYNKEPLLGFKSSARFWGEELINATTTNQVGARVIKRMFDLGSLRVVRAGGRLQDTLLLRISSAAMLDVGHAYVDGFDSSTLIETVQKGIRTLPELVDILIRLEEKRFVEARTCYKYLQQTLTFKVLTGGLS